MVNNTHDHLVMKVSEFPKEQWRCIRCGKRWKVKDGETIDLIILNDSKINGK